MYIYAHLSLGESCISCSQSVCQSLDAFVRGRYYTHVRGNQTIEIYANFQGFPVTIMHYLGW